MASTAIEPAEAKPSMGRVIGQGLALIGRDPLRVLGLACLAGALPSAILTFALYSISGASDGTPWSATDIGLATSVLLWLASSIWSGVLIQGLLSAASGDRKGDRGGLAPGRGNAVPGLVALAFVMTAGIVLGALFLAVPAALLCLRWAVAAPVLVRERRGLSDALRRSAALTRGARWRVLGLTVVLLLFSLALYATAALAGGALFGGGEAIELAAGGVWRPGRLLLDLAVLSLSWTIWGTTQAALYDELRASKEGGTPDRLADVFA